MYHEWKRWEQSYCSVHVYGVIHFRDCVCSLWRESVQVFLIFCIYLYYCRRSPIIKKGGWVGIPRNWFNSPTFFISMSRCGILTMDITDDPDNIGLSFHYLFFTSPQLLLHVTPLDLKAYGYLKLSTLNQWDHSHTQRVLWLRCLCEIVSNIKGWKLWSCIVSLLSSRFILNWWFSLERLYIVFYLSFGQDMFM